MKETYVVFLRGINVGGHHKVPMADLRKELEKIGYEKVVTILNSGNIILDADDSNSENIEKMISAHLENYFNFPIPTIARKFDEIDKLFQNNPFKDIEITKEIRLYISFLKSDTNSELDLPWISSDKSYRILDKQGKTILSVLDLSFSKTPKAMEVLEKCFGKNITTRNWNTIKRIIKKKTVSH